MSQFEICVVANVESGDPTNAVMGGYAQPFGGCQRCKATSVSGDTCLHIGANFKLRHYRGNQFV